MLSYKLKTTFLQKLRVAYTLKKEGGEAIHPAQITSRFLPHSKSAFTEL